MLQPLNVRSRATTPDFNLDCHFQTLSTPVFVITDFKDYPVSFEIRP